MVGRLLSYWEGNFSGSMLNFARVCFCTRMLFVWRMKDANSRNKKWTDHSLIDYFTQKVVVAKYDSTKPHRAEPHSSSFSIAVGGGLSSHIYLEPGDCSRVIYIYPFCFSWMLITAITSQLPTMKFAAVADNIKEARKVQYVHWSKHPLIPKNSSLYFLQINFWERISDIGYIFLCGLCCKTYWTHWSTNCLSGRLISMIQPRSKGIRLCRALLPCWKLLTDTYHLQGCNEDLL